METITIIDKLNDRTRAKGGIMRIKSKDIAKALKLSPATVSLVLNERPGVNEKTRQKVLTYLEKISVEEYQTYYSDVKKGTIIMLNYIKNGMVLPRGVKKQMSVITQIEEALKKAGYHFKLIEYWEKNTNIEELLEKIQTQEVKGLYILAAEMNQADIYPFLRLKIPVIAGDNLFHQQDIDSFLIDNQEGIERGVNYLLEKGHSNIVYLAENLNIFNFAERREAFIREMTKCHGIDTRKYIKPLGNNVDEVYESMKKYLDEGIKKTTAFILESSVVSLGVSRAILERQIRIPRDISLIGFDALPPVSLLKMELTLVKGTHTRRHLAAVKHLVQRIEDNETEIVRIYYKTRLIEGDSVFDKTKYIYRA